MHQSTTPSLSQTIWSKLTSRQFLNLPKVQDLLPVAFGYPLWDNWEDERGCDEGHWHAHKRGGLPWGLREVVGTVEQVHCSRRRLLRRGQEFHECTINKSARTKKSVNLFNDPHIYIYANSLIVPVIANTNNSKCFFWYCYQISIIFFLILVIWFCLVMFCGISNLVGY